MDIDGRKLDQLAMTGGVVNLSGWYYDIVVTRLEKKGYRRQGRIPFTCDSGLEGAVYTNDSGGKFEVVTYRIGAQTWVKSTPGTPQN